MDSRDITVPDRLSAALADRYRLERELGAGGMATVYLAEDLKHRRQVAIKVLRPELAAVIGAERFLAEIRTTANLQHPHILPLHDSGEADGFLFYVMPYIEGESLRDRLSREKQLPVPDAMRIASEVASALGYAHRHGVIHRDIKPENILLHDGSALVADFGIALAASKAGGSRMTETGMSLGTPHYMSPEQAMGEREITARSDVYALGCITYEMLTGDPPFTGSSAQAIVARVVTETPRPMVPQRRSIPPHVEVAVLTALEKLPADRYATAAEFATALGDTSAVATRATVATGRAAQRLSSLRAWLALPLGGLALLLGMTALWLGLRPRPAALLQRFALGLPESQAVREMALISPDGRRIVYVGPGPASTNAPQLWLKEHDRVGAVPIPGTVGVRVFTFSPDGEWIAFASGGQLRKLSLGGGTAIAIGDSAAATAGVAWLDDHSLVYSQLVTRNLRRVNENGGPSEIVHRGDSVPAVLPRALPGSRMLLFTNCRGGVCGLTQDLWALDLKTHRAKPLVQGVVSGDYVATGHLVYLRRDGAMLAVRFDPGSATLHGSAVPVLDSVMSGIGVLPYYSISRTGTLILRSGAMSAGEQYQMVLVDRAGTAVLVDPDWTFRMAAFGNNAGWSVSPDGERVAIGLATGSGDDIWVKHLPRGALSRVSFDTAADFRPRWMPDGRSVMYVSIRGAPIHGIPGARLYSRLADGTGHDSLLLNIDLGLYEATWSRDGMWLVFRTGGVINQVGGRDIRGIRLGVDTASVPLLVSTEFDESAPALSPDGRFIAYESNETGQVEVYVRPFPAVDAGKWQISTSGGQAPLWGPGGRELVFVNGAREMISVPVLPGAVFATGERHTLFKLDAALYLSPTENYTPYALMPDGQHFLMARQLHSAGADAPVTVVENWFNDLRARTGQRGN